MRAVQEILRNVKDRLSGRSSYTLAFGPVSVTLNDLSDHQKEILRTTVSFGDTARNLEAARKKGIKPLSLAEVLSQNNGQTDNLVLFDTADPAVMGPGNHWRVLSLDQEKRIGTLQLCGIFGNYDYRQVPPVEVPFDAVMFTGVSSHFTVSGTPAKLADIVRTLQESLQQEKEINEKLELGSELIYFSTTTGALRQRGGRLIYS